MNSPYFVYRLLAPRPTFPADITEDEAAIMRQHAQYWAGLLGRGHAVMFGQVLDPAGCWGLAVVEAGSIEQVRAFGAADPAFTTELMAFEVFPMPVAQARPYQNGNGQ